MKTLHFASILVLASSVTFVACDDDEDRVTPGAAGASGAAGENSSAGSTTAGKNGTAGSSTAGSGGNTAGTGGSTTDAGAGGVGGVNEGGLGGVGGEGLGGEAGSAGEGGLGGAGGAGGAGGEGGAPVVVPDVLVNGPVELIGTWKDPEWGGIDVITANTWSGANIVGYDSGAKTVYWHNPASSFYPGKYTKVVFTAPVNDAFYYCQIVYNAESLEAAKADTNVADPTKVEDKGCGGSFDWTKVIKQP